jgi:hypothetical protein
MRGSGGIPPLILDLSMRYGDWLASNPYWFITGKFPQYPLNRSVAGPQNLNALEKRKICVPSWRFNHNS